MKIGKRRLSGGLLTLVLMLLAIALAGSGCIQNVQPIGWSGVTVSDNTLFVGSVEGKLVAINLADESRQWSEPLRSTSTGTGFGCLPAAGGCASTPAGVAIYGTPVVSGELVYISGYNGKILAFNTGSLGPRWVYPVEGSLEPFVGGPVIAQNKVYVGNSDGKLYALDAATGAKQWEFESGDKIWATPAIDGDTVYIGSFDNTLYALNATNGSVKWDFQTGGSIAATPLVYNNTVYIGSFDRYLYALDAATGNLKWKFMSENWFWAKPVAYGNTIYAPSLDGKIYALQADSGDRIAEFDAGSPISSSPVIVNDSVIYASQQGTVYSLDTGTNNYRLLADIEKKTYSSLYANEGIVYIHTQDGFLNRVNASTGAKLISIPLKSND